MEKGGAHISPEEQQTLLKEVQARYEQELDPLFAASQLWVDGVVDPLETRSIISRGIAMADNNPTIPQFNPGVLQA